MGTSCANVFRNAEKKIHCSVHGDDFTSEGPKPALDWFEKSVAGKYEITVSPRLGPCPTDAKEGTCLNRVIRWCDGHIEYEADPRQAEKLIAECGLEGAKSVATPGVKSSFHELEEDTPLAPGRHTAFRGSAARGNYLAADRPDAQFACKEVCRWMSGPSEQAWTALKRVGRFLSSAPRLVYTYPQQTVEGIDVYTDTDWAGCARTRKSTSGGCVLLGRHAIKHWSSTQSSVALSSGEAEFAGVIRGSGQGLGYQALLQDFGVEAGLRVWTDSSAAIGICNRQGLGKLRHLDTHTLWIQQAVRTGRVDLRKVAGEVNPADLFTKHSLSRLRLEQLVALHGCKYLGGRAESAPLTRTGVSNKATMASEGVGLGAAVGNGENPLGAIPGGVVVVGSSGDAAMDGSGPHESDPQMPHNSYEADELNRLYPPIVAPADERMEDYVDDTADGVLQSGLRIAEGIRENMISKGRTRWRDDQNGVGLVCESRPSQPTHTDDGMQLYASASGKQLYASADVLIGEYGPHEPTHTENRLAGESLSTPAKEIAEIEKQEEHERGKKGETHPCGEVRSQEECEEIRSHGLLAGPLLHAGDDGLAGQSSPSRRDCVCISRSSERSRSFQVLHSFVNILRVQQSDL